MYKFLNNNKYGLFEDDCTIRAISLAEGTTWDYTYDKLSNLAQSKGTMMNDRDFIRWYLDTNYERVPFLYHTVGETAGLYPDKILLITMSGHITCAKNGIVYDSFDCRKRTTEDAWIVN